jgi:hypothetical protein
VQSGDAELERAELPWHRQGMPPVKGIGRMKRDRPDLAPALARAEWLEKALSQLPVVDRDGTWQSMVLQRHARRQAEFALAASLRSLQMGRATITMSESAGTSIRMFGIRTSSIDGFGEACRLWIESVRRQASTEE